jgi:hypothetical protein
VTVRDWYQLTLKEGLTRFRDQAFAADYDAAATAAASAAAVCSPPTSSNGSSSSTPQTHFEASLLQNIAAMAQHMKTAAAEAAAEPAGFIPAALAAAPASAPETAAASGAVSGPAFACSWHRVLEAQGIRGDQMPEDEGCLSHPIRPCCGTSLDNLYTDTVYNKVCDARAYYGSSSSSSSEGRGYTSH